MKINNEILFNAIGELGDDDIKFAEGFLEEQFATRGFKPLRWQFTGLIAAALVLVAGTVFMFHALAPVDVVPPTTDVPSTSQNTPPIATEPHKPAAGEWTWIVEPVLIPIEYEFTFGYCYLCDLFVKDTWLGDVHHVDTVVFSTIVDEKTGLSTGAEHECQPYKIGERVWMYDPDLDLFGWFHTVGYEELNFGIYPMAEYDEHFSEYKNTVKAVRRIDSTLLFPQGIQSQIIIDGEAFSGIAVAVGNEFVTDFVYEWESGFARKFEGFVTVSDYEGMDGVVNRDGDVIVPFEFSAILTICENTAFATMGMGWGIIGFNGYEGDTEEYPQVDCDVCGMLQFPICATECNRQSVTTEPSTASEPPAFITLEKAWELLREYVTESVLVEIEYVGDAKLRGGGIPEHHLDDLYYFYVQYNRYSDPKYYTIFTVSKKYGSVWVNKGGWRDLSTFSQDELLALYVTTRVCNYNQGIACLIVCSVCQPSRPAILARCNCGKDDCKTEWSPKIPSNATMNDNFTGDYVSIVLDPKISAPNKIHEMSFFGNFPMIEISHTSIFTNQEHLETILSQKDSSGCFYRWGWGDDGWGTAPYSQSLRIKLPVDNKQNVLDIIKILEQIEGVTWVGPNYIYLPDFND
jgi:hypothetical protein